MKKELVELGSSTGKAEGFEKSLKNAWVVWRGGGRPMSEATLGYASAGLDLLFPVTFLIALQLNRA